MTNDREASKRFTFSDVDTSGRTDALQAQLRFQAQQFAEDRRIRLAQLGLRPGDNALDVGCGLGEVAAMLAELVGPGGRVIGVDPSEAMVAQARLTTKGLSQVEIASGNAMALDLPTETFDAVYSERVFMHLDDPATAVREVVRVTKPGGRVMIVDPDHSMTRVDVADMETGAVLFWTMATSKMKNPRSGTLLLSQFRDAGLDDVSISGTVSALREPMSDATTFVASFREAADLAVTRGAVDGAAADAVVADLSGRLQSGTFVMLMTMFTVQGTKPL